MLTSDQRRRTGRAAFSRYLVLGLILFSILRFVSGRSDWYRAWIYCAITTGTQMAVGLLLLKRNPELLLERSKMREGTKSWDKWLVPLLGAVGPIAMWCLAAWDVRTAWPPPVPVWASAAAFILCVAAMLFTLWAMMTNRFFASTVRIQSERGHHVIDTGPYRLVRHPGYAGAGAFSALSPIALGSWLALWAAGFILIILVIRTALEDRTLQAELPGYAKYGKRTRYRLIPGLW
jgi:protein-S-isoprenylcysteine O-methyltransferase Ste14